MTAPFIVLEGLDGAGTTTQLAALGEALAEAGAQVLITREPTTGPVGRVLRRSLAGDADAPPMAALPWLFAADRADHVFREIEPSRAKGVWVLSDRYVPSSLAYQSLTLPLEEVMALNAAFPAPDLLVFVDVPVDVGLARVHARGGPREIFERRDRLVPVAEAYERVLARLAARGDVIRRVDGTADVQTVTAAVIAAVKEVVGWPSSSNSPA